MANKRKTTTAIVAGVTAVALLLGGTFAWTSIQQEAKNETAGVVNVGGRLHDDFNGTNKDVYVENFTDPLDGGQPIYARIRLDEYMEVGKDAGGIDVDNDGTIDVVPVVDGTNRNDVTTWIPHVPSTACEKCDTGETCQIHTYWNWTMGGQTTFMPTFNKDKDSLAADINGTYAGTDANDKVYYDDYVTYVTADGVHVNTINNSATDADGNALTIPENEYLNDTNFLTGIDTGVSTVTGNAYYDNDTDNEDNGGTTAVEETHNAKLTADGSVIMMSEWDGQPGNYWVYDTDGWAYWAAPIMPGEATALLLNEIGMNSNPGEKCYYAINVVGQFATAGDWAPFDTDTSDAPTAEAMTLLNAAVAAVPTVTVTLADGEDATVRPGESITFEANVTTGASVTALAAADVEWTVYDENMVEITEGTTIADGVLTVSATETSKTLTVAARSTTYNGAVGICAVSVSDEFITTDDMNGSKAYALVITEPGVGTTLTFVRSMDGEGSTYKGLEIKNKYELDETAVFTEVSQTPWYPGRALITDVVFENKIKPASIDYWFSSITRLQTADLTNLDVSNLTSLAKVFERCQELETVTGMEGWDVSNVTDMSSMFSLCQALTSVGDISRWDVSNVTNMSGMFTLCEDITSVGDLSRWDVSNVTNMSTMFYGCNALTSVGDISSWDVSNVTKIGQMFYECNALTSVGDLSRWDVSNVTNMSGMFYECNALTSVGDISSWDVSSVEYMGYMFNNCTSMEQLDLSGWDVSNVTDYSDFNKNATNITPPVWVK